MNPIAGKAEQSAEFSDEMRPEYDFSRGVRGKHAHLFGKSDEDESLVAAFWQGKGLDPQPFDKADRRFSKTPDFKLFRNGILVAYCEVKSFQHDPWLDEALDAIEPEEFVNGTRPDPVYNRISNAIHIAAGHLESVNLKHERLNFMVMVNRDKHAKREDMESVLTGYWDPLNGEFDETHTAFSEGRIREDKRKIDLYIWMELSSEGALICKSCFFGNDSTKNEVCNLLGIDSEAVMIIS
jgi:hypothetical protein